MMQPWGRHDTICQACLALALTLKGSHKAITLLLYLVILLYHIVIHVLVLTPSMLKT